MWSKTEDYVTAGKVIRRTNQDVTDPEHWLVLLFAAQVAGGAGERDCAAPRGRPRHRHRPHLRQALIYNHIPIYILFIKS